ncbi:hypothetical protein [Streptomyces sp. NPDC047968]|uniref:hypothetical protein n=1 Tax=unclassified Streptomyces TaxID=2593676 RepID=UPI00341A609B
MAQPATTPTKPAPAPAVALELRDMTAAADLLEALRGNPPRTEADARRRSRLADNLDRALSTPLLASSRHAHRPAESRRKPA